MFFFHSKFHDGTISMEQIGEKYNGNSNRQYYSNDRIIKEELQDISWEYKRSRKSLIFGIIVSFGLGVLAHMIYNKISIEPRKNKINLILKYWKNIKNKNNKIAVLKLFSNFPTEGKLQYTTTIINNIIKNDHSTWLLGEIMNHKQVNKYVEEFLYGLHYNELTKLYNRLFKEKLS